LSTKVQRSTERKKRKFSGKVKGGHHIQQQRQQPRTMQTRTTNEIFLLILFVKRLGNGVCGMRITTNANVDEDDDEDDMQH
jgi:hypothetical protein